MKRTLIIVVATILALVDRTRAGTMFGALSNFDAVNDTGSPCNGFEIELEDIHTSDVTYTFQYQRYGIPRISEDTVVVNGVTLPRTFVRWMSPYDQVLHVFTETTLVAPLGFKDTGGHLCFKNMSVNGQPYDTSGCEHFGVGTLKNPSKTVYRWMQEDPAAPGSLIAQGSPVTIPAPVWNVVPVLNQPPIVAAVIPVPPPPAVVPVPYLPEAEFGVAVWAKVFETESEVQADLHHLVSDDEAVPGNLGPVPNPQSVTETEWQILQTDKMNPSANELAFSRQMGVGHVSVTRRYEFYKYVGPYEIDTPDGPNTGTNEAICPHVAADEMHGVGFDAGHNVDCSALIVVGEYIGAQNAAADVGTPLSANGAILAHGEVGVHYPDRPLIFGGGGGPYSIVFTGGTLPASDPGNEFTLDSLTGVLIGGTPNGTGTATFTVHATDLVEPAQPAVDPTFNITVVDAVTVDDIAIPDGTKDVETIANLTASGGESPFKWTALSITVGLQASVLGNSLSLTANNTGVFEVQVTVDDSLGGTSMKTLTYTVAEAGGSTPTQTATQTATDTPTVTNTATPTSTPTSTPTITLAPGLSIALIASAGRPGAIACVASTLATGGESLTSAANDIGYDASEFVVASCTINPQIGPGTTANKTLTHSALGAGLERVSTGASNNPLPDGPLYLCKLSVSAATVAGNYPISNAASAVDMFGNTLANAAGGGTGVVVTQCSGDCDGNGTVTIGEIVKTVNVFLGRPLCDPAVPTASCPVADADFDGAVSLGEVMQTVAASLRNCQ